MAGNSVLPSPVGEQVWLRSPWPLFFAICGLAAVWTLVAGSPLEPLEMRWFGQVLQWRYARGVAPPADPSIVHLDITRTDLEKLPTLELEYRNAATIIRQAAELGARVIAFDVVFGRGDQAMAEPILQEVERARGEGRTVLFAEALLPSAESGREERIRSFPFRERVLPAGLINVQADGDGVLRRYEYVRRSGPDKYDPSLGLASYLAWRELDWEKGVSFPRPGVLRWEEISSDFTTIEPRELKLEPILLNYRSPWSGSGPGAFRHYNVAQLAALHDASQKSKAQPLTNAVVLVAYVGAGLGDMGTTSLAANQPRVLLHSTALNDLMQRNWIRRSARWVDTLAILALLLLGALASLFRGALWLLLFWVAGVAAAAVLSALLIIKAGLVPGLVTVSVVWSLATFVELGRRQSCEFVQRLRLRATMGLYFSPHIMEEVLKNPGSMEPQQAELTLLLTDLRNSTAIAECLGPNGIFQLLNQVFETQTTAIMAEDGSMEHFLGDQFLSYWGAPNPQRDAADRAFRAALALIAGMEQVRPKLDPRVERLFGYGVALHSGTALIGNKGSAQRLDYGLVGDLINSAARVESLTKHYGILFLVTREAYARISAPPPARLIDKVLAKGKTRPLELLEVRQPFSPARFEEVADRYHSAFADYERGEFAEAERKFAALGEDAQDKPSVLMAERCRELRAEPPEDWDGIYKLKAK
ncbi:MAG TPA: adenylate/guanylate cyclase domain-containing protein [Chthoniobacterales bacterium]|nr:adenylate/guanylate cyclase domain-containing protein [Chthoniobacterales bacterium]